MKRINATERCEMTDSEMATEMANLNIPHIDMGEGPKTVRHTGPNGEIVDEVVRSGEPGISESWDVQSPDGTIRRNVRDAKRQRDIQSGRLVETL